MKTLLEPADIHTNDDETWLAVSHVDSRGRKDSRYLFFFDRPAREQAARALHDIDILDPPAAKNP